LTIAQLTDRPTTFSSTDEAIFSKVAWRILPLLTLCYVVAFLDRINIGFAQLQMQKALAFSNEAFAFGAGVFFVGYFMFEVPSNLMLEKIGARKTLLRIMFCWGLLASAMIYVQSPWQFYTLRFLLGVFEAGFFPGIILYLTYWFPAAKRARMISIFMTGTAIAQLVAGPLSGATLKYMDGFLQHQGWQWLFVSQGLPATLLGVIVYVVLKDKPEDAPWLSAVEKSTLRQHLDNDQHGVTAASHGKSYKSLLRDPKIYLLAIIYFMFLGATYGMNFWTPMLIKSWGVPDVLTIGLLTTIPSAFGIVGMILLGRSSDRRVERRWHFFISSALGAAGILMTIFSLGNLAWSLAGLCVMSVGKLSQTPLFFTAVSEYLPKKTAAGGIAMVSSVGALGPSVIPYLMAWITSHTGSQANGLYVVMVLYLVAGFLLLAIVRGSSNRHR
jgi:D-galactonate transporter